MKTMPFDDFNVPKGVLTEPELLLNHVLPLKSSADILQQSRIFRHRLTGERYYVHHSELFPYHTNLKA